MPATVGELFAAADLQPAVPVSSRRPIQETVPGVYVVALTEDPNSKGAALANPPLDRATLDELLTVRPELRMNRARPDADDLIERIGGFWLPDEVVLYIGLAGTSLRTRTGQYYKTPLGARGPHAGGWWLKTLSVLDALSVFWAATPDYERAEKLMLHAFARGVSQAGRNALLDDQHIMPFANLRGHDNGIKAHHITGATGELPGRSPTAAPRRRAAMSKAATPSLTPRPVSPSGDSLTQRITGVDLAAGRIRLPRASKVLLPGERVDVTVNLRGTELRARWDPRFGPPERSGVLAFGRDKLAARVTTDEVLRVVAGVDDAHVELS